MIQVNAYWNALRAVRFPHTPAWARGEVLRSLSVSFPAHSCGLWDGCELILFISNHLLSPENFEFCHDFLSPTPPPLQAARFLPSASLKWQAPSQPDSPVTCRLLWGLTHCFCYFGSLFGSSSVFTNPKSASGHRSQRRTEGLSLLVKGKDCKNCSS